MPMHRPYDHLILDWNGTLLDDVEIAVEVVNRLREAHGLPAIDITSYRSLFHFPIRSFYAAMGFDTSSPAFPAVMSSYLQFFNPMALECSLHPGASQLVAAAKAAGLTVSILSASHRDVLMRALRVHGLQDHLDHVYALDDEHAAGKLELADALDQRLRRPGLRALLVGDTVHDRDVARKFGWDLVIVPNGHQWDHAFDGKDRKANSLIETIDLLKPQSRPEDGRLFNAQCQ